VALLSPRPPAFIALNEPENSLHPQMLPALASLIAEASRYSQIWLTSHSPELAKLIEKHRSFSCISCRWRKGNEDGAAGINAGWRYAYPAYK
jgi:predicted ATPase